MTKTYNKGKNGGVMDTITITPTDGGHDVMINIDQSVSNRTTLNHTIHIPLNEFRELVKEVL